jgi:hypothetical protein
MHIQQRENNNNNSVQFFIQFFIIYMPSQQLQGQLQTQHSVDTVNYNNNNNNNNTILCLFTCLLKNKENHNKYIQTIKE